MNPSPRISFHANSYNRLPLLKNLLASFEQCCLYQNVEWVITDFGSTDGSRQWLSQYAQHSLIPVKLLFEDEQEYFKQIRCRGLPIDSRWARFRAILGHYRNCARAAATGEIFFDVAEDHQFIRQGSWIDEVLNIWHHRQETSGKDDISGIVAYGYYRWRLDKKNNTRGPVQYTRSVPYYVAQEKTYVDYSVMKRVTFERLGPYLTPLSIPLPSSAAAMWVAEDDAIQPETEYERRCRQAGLVRVFMKYPILASFPNESQTELSAPADGQLIAPLWTLAELEETFGHYKRPVSSEELMSKMVMPTPVV